MDDDAEVIDDRDINQRRHVRVQLDSLLVRRRLPFAPVRGAVEWPGSDIITAGPEIPYGRIDRLMHVWLATMGARHGRRFRCSLDDVSAFFGATWPASMTHRSLTRIARSSTRIQDSEIASTIAHLGINGSICEIAIGHIQPIPLDASVSSAIFRQPSSGVLDLYLWQVDYAHRAPHLPQYVPLDDVAQAVYSATTSHGKAKQLIRQRQQRLQQLWPSSPNRIIRARSRDLFEVGNAP